MFLGQNYTLMVVGGYDGNIRHDDTQVMSGIYSCKNLQNYPMALSGTSGSIISNNAIVCGGFSGNPLVKIKKKSITISDTFEYQ